MDGLCLNGAGVSRIITPSPFPVGESRAPPAHVSTVSRRAAAASAGTNVSMETAAEPAASYSLLRPSRLFYPAPEKRNDDIALQGAAAPEEERGSECDIPALENGRQGSWAMKILHIRSIWPENKTAEHERLEQIQGEGEDKSHSDCSCCGEESEEGCRVGNDPVEFDRDSFSRLLRRVSLAEAKLFAQMSYLGNLAYSINKIKPGNLLKFHGLRFVTSSLEKKVQPVNSDKEKKLQQTDTEKEESTSQVQENEREAEVEKQEKIGYSISASAAYQIAAAAASYVQSHTRSILSFKSTKIAKMEDTGEEHNVHDTTEKCGFTSTQMASFVATTSSVTAVVAAEEEMKQSVAKDLNSAQSSPCEWFICDEDTSRTRFFVIQGSESMASWQANLLFEPIQFEGLDVLVHRGIYEAAKGIYERMLPEVMAHLKACGDSAKLRFTGHSLGGSLALLMNLMLLIRGGAPLSSLLPVITFGSPSIMCGGNRLLHKLGLPQSHVQAVTMHRDIVPRAFSCNYPDNVAKLLTAINGKFRNHPCLKNQKMLYAPMGELVILQPDEKISPHHHLLPSGSGLYLLSEPASQSTESTSQLRAAQTVFLNSPHPLEILSDPSAYGSEGTIYRDHDVNSYFRSVRSVLRQELNNGRKAKREQRRKLWWPIVVVAPQGINGSIIVGSGSGGNAGEQEQVTFWDVFRSGKESLSRFASQHPHILVFLLFPARSLLLGTLAVFSNFR